MGEAAVTLVARVNLADAPAQLQALKAQILEIGDDSFTVGEKQQIAAARTANGLDRLISRHNAEAQALEGLKGKVEGTTAEYGKFTDKIASWLGGDADKKTDQWASAIDRVGEAASGATGFMGTFGAQLVGQGGIVAGGFLAAQALEGFVGTIHEAIAAGAEEQAQMAAMANTVQGLGRNVGEANAIVHEFAGQFSTEGGIAQAVTNLSVLNLSWSQQREIIDATTRLAIDRSHDVGTSLEGVTRALESGRTEALKRMGIIVDSAQAEKDYAARLHITGRALDDQEKHFAVADDALKKMEDLVQNATGDHHTLQNTLNDEKVAWKTLLEQIGAGDGVLGKAAGAWENLKLTVLDALLGISMAQANAAGSHPLFKLPGAHEAAAHGLSHGLQDFNISLGNSALDRAAAALGHKDQTAAEEAAKRQGDAAAAHARAVHAHAVHAHHAHHAAAHHAAANHEAHVLEATEKHWMALGARKALDDIAKTTFSEDLAGGGKYARLAASKTALDNVQGQLDEAHRTMGPMTLHERQAYDTSLGELPRLQQNYDKQRASWQIARAGEGRKLAEESAKAEADAVANVQDRAMAQEAARYGKEQSDIRANYGDDAQLLAEAYTVHQQKLTKIQRDESEKRMQLSMDEVAHEEKTFGRIASMIAHPNANALASMPFQQVGEGLGSWASHSNDPGLKAAAPAITGGADMLGAAFTGAISLLEESSKRQLEAANLQLQASGDSITASAQDAINVENAKENLQTVSTWAPIVGVLAEMGTIAADIGTVVEIGVENIGAGIGNLVADIGIGIANVGIGIGDTIHNAFDDIFGGGKHQWNHQIAYNPFHAPAASQMPNIAADATSAWNNFVTNPESSAQAQLNEASAAGPMRQAALHSSQQAHLLKLAQQYGINSIQYKEAQIRNQDHNSMSQGVQQLVGDIYKHAGGTNPSWMTALSSEASSLEGLTPAQLASVNTGQIATHLNQQNPGANFSSSDISTLVQTISNGQDQLSQDIKNLLMNGSSVNKPLYAQVVNFHDMWTAMPAGIWFRASGPLASVSLASGSNVTPGGGNLGSMNPARTVGS